MASAVADGDLLPHEACRLARYFSDLEHGGSERAYLAALGVRNAILGEPDAHPNDPEKAFARYRQRKPESLPEPWETQASRLACR